MSEKNTLELLELKFPLIFLFFHHLLFFKIIKYVQIVDSVSFWNYNISGSEI
jgi:hypothetical protein